MLAGRAPLGPLFLVYLLGAITVAAPTPLLAYRAFGLSRSHYVIERDGIRLKWGFREEDIPISEIEWVEYAEDLIVPLKKPRRNLAGGSGWQNRTGRPWGGGVPCLRRS